ncbi:MAG: uncharacterized protein KVP18_004263 [Porospora cf. gigantea A]|uniref:uncharacterized protein n=1 Tax=Porospora cf. gigantea A TaxID=2853593 RepID=UPI00355989FE|nr:MAG: hypothetical protein KVP18_004263 [Porospora cf. gigantea A]
MVSVWCDVNRSCYRVQWSTGQKNRQSRSFSFNDNGKENAAEQATVFAEKLRQDLSRLEWRRPMPAEPANFTDLLGSTKDLVNSSNGRSTAHDDPDVSWTLRSARLGLLAVLSALDKPAVSPSTLEICRGQLFGVAHLLEELSRSSLNQ